MLRNCSPVTSLPRTLRTSCGYSQLASFPISGHKSQRDLRPDGGDDGIRTHDPLLAGQVLSQLSYTPILLWDLLSPFSSISGEDFTLPSTEDVGIELSSRTVSRKVFSPLQSLTSVFGMGTGGPSAFITPTIFSRFDP